MHGYQHIIKPLGDRLAALILLALLLPVWLPLMLLLWIVNGGKPFFFQQRPGLNGKVFVLMKFRTMKGLLTPEATRWQYVTGVRDVDVISPDNWIIDQVGLDRPGNQDIQLALFYSYSTNLPLYPAWQAYFRKYQPPALITWGKNDEIFPASGAHPYQEDLQHTELHLLDTGHFALEEDGAQIASLIAQFLLKHNIR